MVRDEQDFRTEKRRVKKLEKSKIERQRLVIKKIDSKLNQLHNESNHESKSQNGFHVKCESVEIGSKFSFPYMSSTKPSDNGEEIPDTTKALKIAVRPKAKLNENLQAKLQDRIKKVMRANLTNIKCKEITSRNTHEYCTDSPFNQMIRNFNEFVILANEKVESREEVNLIIEACKRLSHKPQKTMYLPFYSSSDFIDEVKLKVLEKFLEIVNEQNEMKINSPPDSPGLDQYTRSNGFKAFIERGNNGTIVKTVLNRRSWWSIQDNHDDNYESSDFIWTQWLKSHIIEILPTELGSSLVVPTYNKIEANFNLSNKKNLFLNLSSYYKDINEDYSEHIPLTFLIQGGKDDKSFQDFRQYYIMISSLDNEDNKWICKPGENSNRGQHICVHDKIEQIEAYVETGKRSCYIIQKYLHNPLLINKRKFDIR